MRQASLATRSRSAPLSVPTIGGGFVRRLRLAFGGQGGFALVPFMDHVDGGHGADQTGMGQAGEAHAGDMPGGGVDAVEIPDGLGRVGEIIRQETAAVLLGEDAGEAVRRDGADVEYVHHQQIPGFGAIDVDGTGQGMGAGKIDIADVGRIVVVGDLAIQEIQGFQDDVLARLHVHDGGDVRMPPVHADVFRLLAEAGARFHFDALGHGGPPLGCGRSLQHPQSAWHLWPRMPVDPSPAGFMTPLPASCSARERGLRDAIEPRTKKAGGVWSVWEWRIPGTGPGIARGDAADFLESRSAGAAYVFINRHRVPSKSRTSAGGPGCRCSLFPEQFSCRAPVRRVT